MIDSSTLQQLFPTADILSEHQPPSPVHQRHYLINGELRPWEGPRDGPFPRMRSWRGHIGTG